MNIFPPPRHLKIFPDEGKNTNHTTSYLGLPRKLPIEAIATKTVGQYQITDET